MAAETELASLPTWLEALLILAPLVAGTILLFGFEDATIQGIGLFLIAAGIIVAGAVLFVRYSE